MEQVRVVSAVYAEEEVEYGLREMVGVVEERLGTMQASALEFVLWRTPFYDVKVVLVVLLGFSFCLC